MKAILMIVLALAAFQAKATPDYDFPADTGFWISAMTQQYQFLTSPRMKAAVQDAQAKKIAPQNEIEQSLLEKAARAQQITQEQFIANEIKERK